MHVRMMGEGRAPGVQHGGNADPGAEAPGIGGDGERRLGRRLHQQVVDHALVLVGDVAQLARQRVDDVKVWDGQQLRFAVGQPSARRRSLALRTMPVTTSNGRRPLPALWAKFVMVSQWTSISDSAGLEGFVVPITSGL